MSVNIPSLLLINTNFLGRIILARPYPSRLALPVTLRAI